MAEARGTNRVAGRTVGGRRDFIGRQLVWQRDSYSGLFLVNNESERNRVQEAARPDIIDAEVLNDQEAISAYGQLGGDYYVFERHGDRMNSADPYVVQRYEERARNALRAGGAVVRITVRGQLPTSADAYVWLDEARGQS